MKVVGSNSSSIYCMEIFSHRFAVKIVMLIWKRRKINKKWQAMTHFCITEHKGSSSKFGLYDGTKYLWIEIQMVWQATTATVSIWELVFDGKEVKCQKNVLRSDRISTSNNNKNFFRLSHLWLGHSLFVLHELVLSDYNIFIYFLKLPFATSFPFLFLSKNCSR